MSMVQEGVRVQWQGRGGRRTKVDGGRGVTRHSSPLLASDGDLKRTGLWWPCSQYGEVAIHDTICCSVVYSHVVYSHGDTFERGCGT